MLSSVFFKTIFSRLNLRSHSSSRKKILRNIFILFVDKIIGILLSLTVGIIVARYLGPSSYGALSYAIAYTGVFSVISTLGVRQILVRDSIRTPEVVLKIYGTALLIQIVSGILCFSCANILALILINDQTQIKLILSISSIPLIFSFSSCLEAWFESKLQSFYIVLAKNASAIILSVFKIFLVIKQASLVWILWANVVEAILYSILLLILFSRKAIILKSLQISWVYAVNLIREGFPLIIAGIAISVNMRIDQIMLANMSTLSEAGLYSAATRISEGWYFLIPILMTSVFPSLVAVRSGESTLNISKFIKAYRVMISISLVAAVLITLFSPWLVFFLYGNQYFGVSRILSVHIWAGINVAIGSVWTTWLLLEQQNHISMYVQFCAALLNIILNFILIPRHGAFGAAIATLISYYISAFIGYFAYKPRVFFGMLSSSAIFWKQG